MHTYSMCLHTHIDYILTILAFFPMIYRPQFFFRTADVTGSVKLPPTVEMVMPGDNATFDIELMVPIAMAEGLRFALREGGKTVGAGVVAKVIE